MTRPVAIGFLFGAWAVTALGQPPAGEGPQLSAARGNAGKRLAEVERQLAAGKAAEATDALRRLLTEAGDDLVTTDGRHYRPARRVAQAVMAKLPPVELRAYRDRADAPAAALLGAGKRDRDPRPLLELVDQYFATSHAEEAFLWLGELAFERGDFRAAETQWRRLLPAGADSPDPGVIQPKFAPAAAAARVALAVVYQGDAARSAAEVVAYRAAHPTAAGKLGGRDGVYADTLRAVLATPPTFPPDAGGGGDWPTFAGDAGRTGHTAGPVPRFWPGRPAWKVPVPVANPGRPVLVPAGVAASTRPVGRHPVVLGGVGYVADASSLFGFDPRTGAERFRYARPDAEPPPAGLDADYVLTAVPATGRLYARLGPPTVAPPPEKGGSVIACFGRPDKPGAPLEWKFDLAPPVEAGVPAAWEAAPAWADGRIYAAFTREANNRLTQAVACYADTGGPPVWVADMADAAVAGRADARTRAEPVTVAGGRVILSTHAGFVAALDARTGKPAWAYAYPPALRPTLRPRDICPPVAVGGRVFAAPTDADRLLALDAVTGRLLWEVEQIQIDQLLGVAADRLIATIAAPQRGLRGFRVTSGGSREPDGWAVHDDPYLASYGRGLVSAGAVLWSTKSGVFFARPDDGLPLAPHLPGPHGNLAYADGVLLVATPTEVWGYVFEPPFDVFGPSGSDPGRAGGLLTTLVRPAGVPLRLLPVALPGPPADPDPCPIGPGVAVTTATLLATPGCVALLAFAPGPTLPGLGSDGGAEPLLLVADARAVYAHRPGERTPAWAAPLPAGVTVTHAHIVDDAVLIAGPGGAILLNKADGAERWHLAWPADAGDWGDFAVAGGRLVARAGDHHLIAIDLATGGVAWVRDASGRARFTATPFAFAPTFAAHFAGVDSGVLAQVVPGRRVYLSGATGEALATAESATGKWPAAPAAAGPGRVAVADGPGTVRVVEYGGPTTPMRGVWKHEAGGETSLTGRPPAVRAVRAGLLAAFDRNHCVELDLLTPTRGQRVWPRSNWLPPGEIDLERSAAGPLSLFVAVQGKLHAVRLADGRPAWARPAGLPGAGSWHVAAGPRGVTVVPVVPPTVDDFGPGPGLVLERFLLGHAGRLPLLLIAQLEGVTTRRVPVVVFDPATGAEVGRVEILAAGPAVGVHLTGPRPVVVTPGVAQWLGSP